MSLIGRHVNISKGLVSSVQHAQNIGCEIFQIFLGNPQSILSKKKSDSELKKFYAELKKLDLIMVVHGSYTVNLANPIDTKKHQDSVKSVIQDMQSTVFFKRRCLGVIIHMGRNVAKVKKSVAIDNYANGIKKILSETPSETYLILETGASQGTEIGSKLKDLSKIYHLLSKKEKKRVNFCVDTCHIWATGYDISNKKGVLRFFNKFDKLIGIDKIACIHFNNSKQICGSHVDRHDDLSHGKINIEGLKHVAKLANKYQIPIITETPLNTFNNQKKRTVIFKDEYQRITDWIQ